MFGPLLLDLVLLVQALSSWNGHQSQELEFFGLFGFGLCGRCLWFDDGNVVGVGR